MKIATADPGPDSDHWVRVAFFREVLSWQEEERVVRACVGGMCDRIARENNEGSPQLRLHPST
jgi:hypothetical protein